ncbi:MarR family transcriptional regulator [Bacillus sp. RO3]|nr:MarR family transcriptional regulator [Bacillus sp. RO3]
MMNKMAEEEFAPIGLSPTYAFMLMTLKNKDGLTQKELSGALNIAPSTSTRFVDKLEMKGLVTRKNEGKLSIVALTDKGYGMQDEISRCWKNLFKRYADIMGEEQARKFTLEVNEANALLENKK